MQRFFDLWGYFCHWLQHSVFGADWLFEASVHAAFPREWGPMLQFDGMKLLDR